MPMPVIRVVTRINAPIELCFDLCPRHRSPHQFHAGHRRRAVAGVKSGLINLGEEVTWEATHFGMRQRLTSRITVFDRPFHFRDSQVNGPSTALTTTIFSQAELAQQSCATCSTMNRPSDGWAVARTSSSCAGIWPHSLRGAHASSRSRRSGTPRVVMWL
jgi:hypothetical protein